MNLFTRARDFAENVGDAVQNVVQPQRPANIGQIARKAVPMLPRSPIAYRQPINTQYEDGSGFQNGQAYGAGDSAGDVPRPLAVRGGYRPGLGAQDIGVHDDMYAQAQGSFAQPEPTMPMNPQLRAYQPVGGITPPNRALGYGALDYEGQLRVR